MMDLTDLKRFRAEFPERIHTVQGLRWRVLDSAASTGRGKVSGSHKTGAPPPLVLLPGTLGTGEIFWQQFHALAPRLRVIALTYPAVGDVIRYADGAAALMRRMGIQRFSLLGTSLGGFTAQMLALRHPARVETLFAANTLCNPRASWRSRNPSAMEVERTPAARIKAERLAGLDAWPESDPGLALAKAVMRDQGENRITARHLKARILALLRAENLPPRDPQPATLPDGRIVVIECADDPIMHPEAREEVRRRYPGAQIHTLPTGGHFPYVSRAEQYTEILRMRLLG